MKLNRTFRHMLTAIATVIGMSHTRSYSDPVFTDGPSKGGDTRARRGRSNFRSHKRLQPPALVPGTITYFDWLVRELGYDRRLADGYMYAFQRGYKVKLPMPLEAI